VDTAQRTPLLRHWLRTEGWKQVLVFVASQYSAEHVANKLYNSGIYATAFHGGLSQGARQQVLDEFKAGRWDVLITTDLASRGIDIAQLPVVINYDLPRSAVDYVHRIGRTGRAGASGLAISLVTPDTRAHWHLIEKRQGLSVPLETVAGFEASENTAAATAPDGGSASSAQAALAPNHPNAPGNGGIKGKRPSKKDKLRAAAAHQTDAASGTGAPYSSDALGPDGRGS
jgi:ATP-dependent RNA helicase RhlE